MTEEEMKEKLCPFKLNKTHPANPDIGTWHYRCEGSKCMGFKEQHSLVDGKYCHCKLIPSG